MARPYPRLFRDDVVRVARNRDDGVTIEQIAADFGVHPVTLSKWLRQADINEGTKLGTTTGDSADSREARRRIKLLERGAAPGRGLSGAIQSAGKRLYPRRGALSTVSAIQESLHHGPRPPREWPTAPRRWRRRPSPGPSMTRLPPSTSGCSGRSGCSMSST